jgi:hypothetical protein
MSDRDKPFTVSDRRHFTPDGQPRSEPTRSAEASTPGRSQPVETPKESRAQAPDDARADLSSFVMSLGAQAAALLAGEGLPEGASPREALEGARSLIAILEMLKDKTEGRRNASEDEVLASILFELRMEYVSRARVSGA